MVQKTTVLHIINDLNIGGAQRIVADLVATANRDKFEPIVFNLNFLAGKLVEEEIRAAGIDVINFRPFVIADFRCIWPIYHTIKSRQIELVHTHLCVASLFGTIASRLAGLRSIVSTEHNTTTFTSRPRSYRMAARLYLCLNARTIAVSEAIKQLIVEISPRLAAKASVIYNGIDLAVFDPAQYTCSNLGHRVRKKIQQPFKVGTLCRQDPRKGFDYFQACAHKVRSEHPEVTFCVGTRDESLSYKNITSYHLKSGKEGVAEYLASLDAFVLPSIEEGLGLVAIEAMAMGKPVIASNVGGLIEVIQDRVNGLLVAPGNVDEMVNAVLLLQSNPRLARRLGKYGRRTVERKFSLMQMISAVEDVYSSLYL